MIRNAATERQVQAADPQGSTWLSANAGSGKTRVLTDRVARLLLEDVDPLHILCLTYTKAAASEMQNRLFKRLGSWAMMSDDDLRDQLMTLGAPAPITADQLRKARVLFARAIETPGGLRIQTIHSFCSSLLRRFPLEAGISPQFAEMEDQQARMLRADVMDQMSQSTPDLVSGIARYLTDEKLDEFLQAIASKKDAFLKPLPNDDLRKTFGLSATDRMDDIPRSVMTQDDKATAQAVQDAFAPATKMYQTFAASLTALPYDAPDWPSFEALCKLFLYQSGDNEGLSKSSNFPQSGHAKAVAAAEPIAEELHSWMDRVETARDKLLTHRAYHRTQALYAFAVPFIQHYEAAKLARGLLDFDDLIGKARDLLTDPAVAQWVLFRLDGGIDHILVDEAQDTSPAQWSVIQSLAQEFSSGEGAQPDRNRTIFVVGDKKQSIYSFQGADPSGFDQMRDHFDTELGNVGAPFSKLELAHSFRSSHAILRVVDHVFGGDHADFEWDSAPHIAFKEKMPGRVDLWPPLEEVEKPKDPDWRKPVDTVSDLDPEVRLAQTIACEIKRMIAEETIPVERGNTGEFDHRPVAAGDILILVQRRSKLFAEIIRACKKAELDIAGADRLKLGAELAVKDITSLLRFLALAEDDLALAEVLKSPLFGWSEQQLFTLAHGRQGKGYLWAALRDAADTHPETLSVLEDMRRWSDYLRPYDLINRLLVRHDGRRKLLSRLGAEAEDGIDALLSQALGYERSAVPSLTGFLEWMQTDDLEIKRQLDSAGDRIRVMTVHGAKGLEAPIVFLPDTALRKPPSAPTLVAQGDSILWPPRKNERPEVIRECLTVHREAQEDERRRLLYVAMTRAESWLIVCSHKPDKPTDNSWHNMVANGLSHSGDVEQKTPTGQGRRFAFGDWQSGQEIAIADPTPTPQSSVLDFTVVENHPVASPTPSPSTLKGDKVLPDESQSDEDGETARLRGTLIHLLLEHLPGLSPDIRPQVGQQLVLADPDTATLPDIDTLISDVMHMIEAPDLAPIFNANALTEVDITADVPNIGRMQGAIDRLIITEDRILIVDYKSNQILPETPAQTPLGLLAQMGAYSAMVSQIWPDRQVDLAILWTSKSILMPIPADLAHDALARVSDENDTLT